MAMPTVLSKVLEATGYLDDGHTPPTVLLGQAARDARRGEFFEPDALWRGPSSLTVYFKYVDADPSSKVVSTWRREIWNEGFAPLLWVVSPSRIDVYNGFSRPTGEQDADTHRLQTFRLIEAELRALDAFAGRLAMETGQFWQHAKKVNRKTTVDAALLHDLAFLEQDLVAANLSRPSAQGLIGRVIFTQYLIDRHIVTTERLKRHSRAKTLPEALRDPNAANALFAWLTRVFNGDMFPKTTSWNHISQRHLKRVADFLDAVHPVTGQHSLFPYQFNVIPVELISAIYEQFVHAGSRIDGHSTKRRTAPLQNARQEGVHYTRLPVVSLILDEVMAGLTGKETVLDLTCGSGVFLVEALRRLVALNGGKSPSRDVIHNTLYEQVFGVDISEAAIRVAAFSLYLAALELDPDPQPPEALTFKPLIGRTLLVGSAHNIETTPSGSTAFFQNGARRKFDLLVGNPPWTFKGRRGTAARRERAKGEPRQPRGEALDFVRRASAFAHDSTRYGFVLPAPSFFAGSATARAAALSTIKLAAPATFVNLSALTWLFPTATMPAALLLGKSEKRPDDRLVVANVPWSPAGASSHSFEIAPSDISSLSIRKWENDPTRLKTVVFGRGRDARVLDALRSRHDALGSWLERANVEWRDGLQYGVALPVGDLFGMELLDTGQMKRFCVPAELPPLQEERAHRPRSRDNYRAPLVLVQEGFAAHPRPVAAVAERDIVYTEAYFGVSLVELGLDVAHMLAGVLSSAVAAWHFLLTASEFGVWKRRLHRQDLDLLPIPPLVSAAKSVAGRKIIHLARSFRTKPPDENGWRALDDAVFELYEIDDLDRLVIRDGMERGKWQWEKGRLMSAEPATPLELEAYADAFIAAVGAWLKATNRRRMRAELFQLPPSSPLRIIRFVLEDSRSRAVIQHTNVAGDLGPVLAAIGERLHVPLASTLVGQRELRVHGDDEVIIIKPAARRFWAAAAALQDADAVVAESFAGAPV